MGGSYLKKYDDAASVLDGNCHKADSAHPLIVAPKSTEWVVNGTAQTVRRAISIFGVTLSSRSGWSTHVKTEWENVGTVPRAICSVYGEPNTAPVTYVGGVISRLRPQRRALSASSQLGRVIMGACEYSSSRTTRAWQPPSAGGCSSKVLSSM